MLDTAVKLSAGEEAFAAWKMDATLFAAHHVLLGAVRMRLLLPLDPFAIGLEHRIGEQQPENQ